MHINFKYFIVSIGSIFLALGIGIIIGSSLGNNETIQKQNEAIVKDIDTKFTDLKKEEEKLKEENKSLKEVSGSYKKFIELNQNELTSNKLSGKNIALISFDEKNTINNLESTITNAGANISCKIIIKDSLFEKGSAEKINEKLQKNITSDEELINLVTNSIKSSVGNRDLNVLVELGYIKLEKMTGQFNSVNSFVFTSPSASKTNKKVLDLDKTIIENIKNEKYTVVVQNSTNSLENIEEFTNMKIATINNVDQPLGQISLVNCLASEKLTGNYGKNKENNIVTIAVNK